MPGIVEIPVAFSFQSRISMCTKKLSQNAICHSVRSEESLISASQTLRVAHGDSFEIVHKFFSLISTVLVRCQNIVNR